MSRQEESQPVKQCQRRTADDKPCHEPALPNRDFCQGCMRAALAKPKRTRRKKSDDDVKLPGEVPPELALGTIDDAMFYTADTLHRVRSGLLPVSRADQVFKGLKVFLQGWELKKKLDPAEEAKKEFARQLARDAAEKIAKDPNRTREILYKRNLLAIEDEMEAIEAEAKIVVEEPKPKMSLERFKAEKLRKRLNQYAPEEKE